MKKVEKKIEASPELKRASEMAPLYGNLLIEIPSENYVSKNGVKATNVQKFDTFVCGEVKGVGAEVVNFEIGDKVWFVRFDAIEVEQGFFVIDYKQLKGRA